jgi:hypothetical protein
MNSFLSRGASDREISISLRHSDSSAAIVYEIVRNYWRKRVGEEVPFSALGKEIANYGRERQPFSERPADEKRRIIIGVALPFLILGGCWYGSSADFLSSTAWARLSWWVAAAGTLLGLFLLMRNGGFASLRNRHGTAGYLVMFGFVFAVFVACGWLVIGRSLPDVVTRLFGRARQSTFILYAEDRSGAKSCQRRVTGELFAERFPGFYCPSNEDFARLPTSGPMLVTAHETWFGTHIDRIEPVDPEFHR